MMEKSKISWWLVIAYSILPIISSFYSTIHVIKFFELTNDFWMAVGIAMTFEIGSLAALAGLVAIDKINKNVIYFLFITLTLYQMMGNAYHAYDYMTVHMDKNPFWIKNWIELFGLQEYDLPLMKRIIAFLSGSFLPIFSLSFLDVLMNYILVSMGLKEAPNKKKLKAQEVVKTEPVAPEPEKIQEEIEPSNISHEEIQKKIKDKKEEIEETRGIYLELLDTFYENGKIKAGDELMNYSSYTAKIDMNKYLHKDINLFLTICNYLEIFRLSGTQRFAVKDYESAKETLSNYLNIGEKI